MMTPTFFKAFLSIILATSISGVLPSSSLASEGGSTLALKHEYFWDANGVWNQTPAFDLHWVFSRKWSLNWAQELDIVTGASRRLGAAQTGQSADRGTDVVSNASKVEVRHSESPGLMYSHKGTVATASFYTSRENDYISYAPAASLAMDFFGRNTTIGASFAQFFDHYKPEGVYTGKGGKKNIRSLGLTLAQSLTPLTLVGFTGSHIYSWGYLGHPYNPPIDINGNMSDEVVPDKKTALALAGQIVQGYHLGDLLGSINLDGRRFQDSWGIKSTTADFKISQYFAEGSYFRLRCRYYNQTGASFAREVNTGNEVYRTADIRFFPFKSWLVGGKISMPFPEAWKDFAILPDQWDIKYDHVLRNTKGDFIATKPGEKNRILYQLYDSDESYQQGTMMVGLLFNF